MPHSNIDILVQTTLEDILQWEAFRVIWRKSTPRQKNFVRDTLQIHIEDAMKLVPEIIHGIRPSGTSKELLQRKPAHPIRRDEDE